MKYSSLVFNYFQLLCVFIIAISCQPDDGPITERIIMDKITIPEGFVIEKLYKPGEHGQGSWVSVTKDNMGRLYCSDQFGNIYRVTLPDDANKMESVAVKKLDLTIGLAQGLLWHKDILYALVNSNEQNDLFIHSGFYKITDSSRDGNFDTVRMIRSFDGNGEHGPHNILLSPDEKSLYLVMGNHTDIPENLSSAVPKVWDEDNLLPVIKDPSGHANTRKAPGGWVLKTDFEGKEWTLVNVGMRNTYDIAFNQDGELFGFDSDMEYDMGMPWYRPIRLFHLTSGGDFGWRTGTGKFPDVYPDNLPGIANLGQGSPTGLLEAKGLKFPSYYQKGLYLFDWSYGTIYYAILNPLGSSYSTEITEFLSGVPLPLTKGIVGDDGAMYFLTGGRKLESALYKLTYTGEKSSDILSLNQNSKGKKKRKFRKKLEALHGKRVSDKINFIIKNLDHSDRFTRYAARVALEHQEYILWKNEISKRTTPLKTIALSLSIARLGNDTDRLSALDILLNIDWTDLEESQKIDFIRAVDLILIRLEGALPEQLKKHIVNTFLPSYLLGSDTMNKELCSLLSYLQVSEIIAPTLYSMENDTITSNLKAAYLSGDITKRSDQYGKDVEKMLQNMPNQQNISYAKSLSVINEGWTTESREKYFRWYNGALKKSGGRMYSQFIKAIQKKALENVPRKDLQYFEALASESMNQNNNAVQDLKQPKGPGQNWNVKSVESAFSRNLVNVNFENGQNFFKASLCSSCHSINGVGGITGPELTQISMRFSVSDLAEAIINPSSTISDRYRNINYYLQDGTMVTGRIVEDTKSELEISTNAFSPELTTKIKKDNIIKEEESIHSAMPTGLINRLNEKELSDLIAFLIAGGNENHKIYNK